MAALSEVSTLIGQRAGELEKAQEIFSAEIRAFISSILGAVARIDPNRGSTGP